jgi:N-glycosylase/DNA lyase
MSNLLIKSATNLSITLSNEVVKITKDIPVVIKSIPNISDAKQLGRLIRSGYIKVYTDDKEFFSKFAKFFQMDLVSKYDELLKDIKEDTEKVEDKIAKVAKNVKNKVEKEALKVVKEIDEVIEKVEDKLEADTKDETVIVESTNETLTEDTTNTTESK